MRKAEIYEIIEILSKVEPGTVRGDEKLLALGEWDSLTSVEFLLELEQRWDIKVEISGVELEQVETVAGIIELLGDEIED